MNLILPVPGAVAASATATSAIYHLTIVQSIPSTTATVVNFDTREIDTDSAVTTGAAWKWTCPTAKGGLYHVAGVVSFAAMTATGECVAVVRKNGVQVQDGGGGAPQTSSTVNHLPFSAYISVAAGDYIDVIAYQTSGVSQNTTGTVDGTRVAILEVG